MQDCDCSFKVVLIGPYGTGKTSLLARLTGQEFSENVATTIGASFTSQECLYNLRIGESIIPTRFTENFWDTAGQERFANLLPSYMRDADVLLLVFSATHFNESFDFLEWLHKISETALKGPPAVVVALNKADLLSGSEAARWNSWCSRINSSADNDPNLDCVRVWCKLKAFVTSAKTGEGVTNLHNCIQKMLALKVLESVGERNSDRVLIPPGAVETCPSRGSSCC